MAPKSTKAERGATAVMETNSASIVSKRSVERIYYPEPHFFRYFVKKPLRRSPLVNRGYWLRMRAVESMVRRFLEGPSGHQKVVVNLGCGFDPLPFQLLNRDAALCQNAKFIDVDHHKLMVKKRDIITQCPALRDLLSDAQLTPETDSILLRSKEYVGIGCDLGDLSELDAALSGVIGLDQASILCIAEVSITYMEVELADALIRFMLKLSNDVNFCLLEQYFPEGPHHPFAAVMMKDFLKLQCPLHSVHKYPSLRQQEQRFRGSGWTNAKATNLWELWNDPTFVTEDERLSLDSIEAFDEWEEFALFASHHFLLSASIRKTAAESEPPDGLGKALVEPSPLALTPLCSPKLTSKRRFGAILPTSANTFGLHGGLGQQTRLSSTDEYTVSKSKTASGEMPPLDVEPRMCHTITQFYGQDCLLVGGRAAPKKVMADCWLRHSGRWNRTDSLPTPLYRHCATAVNLGGNDAYVLIYGGKTNNGDVSGKWFLWNVSKGWQEATVANQSPTARFGASIVNIDGQSGVVFGGMSRYAVVLDDFWTWKLVKSSDGRIHVELNNLTETIGASSPLDIWLGRFGASITTTARGCFIIGGVAKHCCIPQAYEIMLLNKNALDGLVLAPNIPLLTAVDLDLESIGSRPLLVGHSSCKVGDDDVLIVGGGALCFSFGIYWNESTWLLQSAKSKAVNGWSLCEPSTNGHDANPLEEVSTTRVDDRPNTNSPEMEIIPRINISTPQEFQRVVDKAKPVILSGLDLGSCVKTWRKEYLEKAIGRDRKVVVHEAKSENMNFQTKNFSYVTKEFGKFIDEIYDGSRQYLRSVSSVNPMEQPANLAQDFPGLQGDFHLPPELSFVSENAHSFPLRLSGPVILWLHYDVMANVLCQIQGDKRLILYPPSDVLRLGFAPGASSSSINIFKNMSDTSPYSPPNTHPHEARLRPGDVLFIPPLWPHTANPINGVSIAVNAFFRNIDRGYAAGRDAYGNRDLQAYERGRMEVDKIARSFDGLPRDMARFYMDRLADELRRKAHT
ncbi:tRNA wybutosine-synthesizing protein 4 [Histoplasma capsulatum var. duboisii H88]|uniref:tRNA wybutosine-synthesizing protein 4 n=1 Tax=Ajellomyces capsulatus (strain H88) TaxID=544711 RepID=F0UMS6_AJEC8|nr:tRNA wybutosine-synthesizing protein 4 [Histoplasma capsulatum var. duboisii H88]QSS53567.1 leucine carboxyl methyltransferase [Histoplasma capsulatum var. duboisii H88]